MEINATTTTTTTSSKKVASFTIDHDILLPGVYVSRYDFVGKEPVTTFDIRMKKPNAEPVLDNPAIHTLEHLMAVFLRTKSGEWEDKVLYIGPMGCRTGMYLLVKGEMRPVDILPLLNNMFRFIVNFDEPVPATSSKECGNNLDHNLIFAKWEAANYLNNVLTDIKDENMVYPG